MPQNQNNTAVSCSATVKSELYRRKQALAQKKGRAISYDEILRKILFGGR